MPETDLWSKTGVKLNPDPIKPDLTKKIAYLRKDYRNVQVEPPRGQHLTVVDFSTAAFSFDSRSTADFYRRGSRTIYAKVRVIRMPQQKKDFRHSRPGGSRTVSHILLQVAVELS